MRSLLGIEYFRNAPYNLHVALVVWRALSDWERPLFSGDFSICSKHHQALLIAASWNFSSFISVTLYFLVIILPCRGSLFSSCPLDSPVPVWHVVPKSRAELSCATSSFPVFVNTMTILSATLASFFWPFTKWRQCPSTLWAALLWPPATAWSSVVSSPLGFCPAVPSLNVHCPCWLSFILMLNHVLPLLAT